MPKIKKFNPKRGRALNILRAINVILIFAIIGSLYVLFTHAAALPGERGDIEIDQLNKINAARKAAGVQPVELFHIDCIHSVAANWTSHISATQSLDHNPNFAGQIGYTCGGSWNYAAENIGYAGSSDQLFTALMNSQHHRENILSRSVSRVGIGAIVDGNGRLWVTQNFANCSNCSGGWNTPANVPLPHPWAKRIAFGNNGKGFLLDSWGGIWPLNGAPFSVKAAWPNWDIARAITASPDASGVEFLDGFGGVHPGGGAAGIKTPGYWANRDIARDVIVTNWQNMSGLKLDGYGGLWKFGPTPPDTSGAFYYNGFDIARRAVAAPKGGYTLDGWGSMHPFGGARAVVNGPYWKNWDIAKAAAISPDGKQGYVMDGFGGMHPLTISGYPATPPVKYGPYWNTPVAVDMVVTNWDKHQGYILDFRGAVHPFGGAPAVTGAPYWNDAK